MQGETILPRSWLINKDKIFVIILQQLEFISEITKGSNHPCYCRTLQDRQSYDFLHWRSQLVHHEEGQKKGRNGAVIKSLKISSVNICLAPKCDLHKCLVPFSHTFRHIFLFVEFYFPFHKFSLSSLPWEKV